MTNHRLGRLRSSATVFFLSAAALSQSLQVQPNMRPLTPDERTAMTGKSWSPGCPVSLDDLLSIRITYFGFDHLTHKGRLIIHKRFAQEASAIFQELYDIRFPINKIDPYENYEVGGGNAEKNVTVGFYCRKAQDAPKEWSGHAYGIAVDLNPFDNPFHDAKEGWWPKGADARSKRDDTKGKVSPSTEAFQIFARHGWAWGGFYSGEPDYMHFYKATLGGSGNVLERSYVATGLQYVPVEQ
ncbi:hypothetical protein ACPOL_6932 (plasmid) [Acidisarcina polymorpha]|uniref:Peptidase M15C domain-containing protein n=1 Tax=Acidisarcina polymorpha TaxID=2211140 RepID=A0A2Z5GBU4_9BACT|nr:M15 family metallopeptidase [Acidisarcina polymorpha]AXC16114.1 hypothetical protein ACPOL_6906 [Acidisarcina polymorpha]AXC16136.1 hypothetical protein ACPOL_6932 [Acidisarcina polymorpha]